MHKFNNEKKFGPWNIPVVILNESTDILSKAQSLLTNFTANQGTFPEESKSVPIMPEYKNED